MTSTGDGQDPQLHYDTFANTLKGLDSGLIVSASPECQYGSLGSNPLAAAVQFFNNAKCNVASANFPAAFKFWVSQAAANPNGATQVLLGLPGNAGDSSLGAQYYLTPAEALSNVSALRSEYPGAYVGVGVWDAAASTNNNNWAQTVAKGLKNLPAVAVVASSSSLGTVAASSTMATIVAGNSTAKQTTSGVSQSAVSTASASVKSNANAAGSAVSSSSGATVSSEAVAAKSGASRGNGLGAMGAVLVAVSLFSLV
ncbi:hypothetical protein P7C70_g1569, partial [Phenoliferia sp. Uapishka_3]